MRLRTFVLAAGVAFLLCSATAARAEPRFAVREGMHCAHCHINRTGGGMRTSFGTSFAQSNLSTHRVGGVFDPRVGESISFGANLRLSNRTRLPARTEIEGVQRSTVAANSFEMSEANLYFLAEAIPGRLSIYLDETVAPEGASSREAFVLVHGLPLDGYVKAGRFMPPYGLRIPDDNAFIRAATGFNYANADLGVELGIAPHPFSLSLAIINGSLGGSDPNLLKQITTHAVVAGTTLRAGLSFSWNDTSTEDFSFQAITAGAHVAGRFGRLLVLAELDWIRGITDPDPYDQIAFYLEANFEALKGLYFRFIFEAFDPLLSLAENERDRFVLGVSWFPIQLLELRLEYRVNRDIPQRINGNADELIIELHGFL